MTMYVLRHGQTNINAEHRAQGRNGLPLNEEGLCIYFKQWRFTR